MIYKSLFGDGLNMLTFVAQPMFGLEIVMGVMNLVDRRGSLFFPSTNTVLITVINSSGGLIILMMSKNDSHIITKYHPMNSNLVLNENIYELFIGTPPVLLFV